MSSVRKMAGLAMAIVGLCAWAWGQETPKKTEAPAAKAGATADQKTETTAPEKKETATDKAETTEKAEGEGEKSDEEKPKGPPVVVKVGVYILSMGKFDVGTGSFTVDFYLDMTTAEDEKREIPDSWEFMNGRASVDKIISKPHEKFYRVLANLASPIDLKRFPFDTQKLQIIIEDKVLTANEVVYVAAEREKNGLDPSVVFPGWNITDWKIKVSEHNYPVYDESYSQYQFDVNITRIKMNSFMKTFMPVLFLMLIMTSSFILNPDQIVTRLATISSSLVASVMFHLAISSQVPPVGYLTFADKFMGLTYLILLISFFLNISVFVLQGKGQTERAKTLSVLCEKLVFVGVPVLYGALFLFVR